MSLKKNILYLNKMNLIERVKSDNRTKKYIITDKGKKVLVNLEIIKDRVYEVTTNPI